MTNKNIFDLLMATEENQKIYYEEGIIVEFSEKLYQLMKERGLKQKDLAEKMNVKPAQISNWLSGHTNMQLKTIANMLYVMGVKLETFEVSPLVEETSYAKNFTFHKEMPWSSEPRLQQNYIPLNDNSMSVAC